MLAIIHNNNFQVIKSEKINVENRNRLGFTKYTIYNTYVYVTYYYYDVRQSKVVQ